jgi:glucosamine-6-phosphate deaminase
MQASAGKIRQFQAGNLSVRIYETRRDMGEAAATLVADRLRTLSAEHATLPIIFATGASQLETLHALTAIPDLPWSRVIGFHLDEYIGIPESHPASFRRYLRENLSRRVPIGRFYWIDGSSSDPERVSKEYAMLLHSHPPLLGLLGIGENGHLAFNDPAEANFEDPFDVRPVQLDLECRRQQVAEGWFSKLEDVPEQAITLTIPAIMRVPELIVSVPGERKAIIARRTLRDPISAACPATILRRHPHATLFLDAESAAAL